MNYSVIDIGSNSVRHLKAKVENGCIDGEKSLIVTRLGEGVDETKRLTDRAIKDTIEAISTFKKEAEAMSAQGIYLMATSAVRDAQNKDRLIKGVYGETGLEIEVLSGEEEAIIGCKGVQKGLSEDEPILIIDIGGGSTEFIVFDGEIRHASSANVGAVRMTGKYINHDPVTEAEKKTTLTDIKEIIEPHLTQVLKYKFDEVIGIGGTATTFGAIELEMDIYDRHRIHNHVVALESIRQINHRFQTIDVEARKKIPGLAPKRADIITAGGLILEEIIEQTGKGGFRVSDFDNLEGFLAHKLGI